MNNPKMSKSWKITLIALIIAMVLPVANEHLAQFGVIITEAELQHYLYLFFGVSAVGGGLSINKKVQERKNNGATKQTSDTIKKTVEESTSDMKMQINHDIHNLTMDAKKHSGDSITLGNKLDKLEAKLLLKDDPPQLKTGHSWYKSNFEKSDVGNTLEYGEPYLWLKVKGVRSYVTAKLSDASKLIQVEQTGTPNNPWKDTVRLEMFDKADGQIVPLPRGKYTVTVQGDRGFGDAQRVTDEFEIV